MQEVLSRKDELARNSDALEVLFGEMLHMCLWYVDHAPFNNPCLITLKSYANYRGNATVSEL